MKIAILSQEENNYSTQRLKAAALGRGHDVHILHTAKFLIRVEQKNPELYYEGKPVNDYDAVIPRIGASVTFYGTAVVRQFQQMGVFALNPAQAITISRDKLRALQVLSRHNVGLATTAFAKQRSDVLKAIESVGGAPVIIKLLEGTQGIGVILAETKKMAEAVVETLQSTKHQVLIQKFVKESKGKDIRAFVIGDRVVGAMRRLATGDEFRSNVHRGGRAEKVELSPEYQRTAVQAAQIIGLSVAGVDMLESASGPVIMEVNSSPGIEGIEKALKIDIAGEIIKYMEEQVLFPEVDIRQRLTLRSGYGVAEIPVNDQSELANKLIKNTGLKEREVLVLSVLRETLTIPTPKGEDRILVNDILVCYGKLSTLKNLIPPKSKKSKSGK